MLNTPTLIKGVIFDMDGVLCDSEPLINAAAIAMFAELGLKVYPEDFQPFVGCGEIRYLGGVAEAYGFPLDIMASKARTYEIYLGLVPRGLKVFPKALDLVHECRRHGLKTAIASSADRIKVEANLRSIGLPPEQWQVVISAEDAERKKPWPDLFLLAAERLGLEPSACVVIEDAVNGVQAAKAAGMRCIAVATSFAAEALAGADVVRSSLAEVSLADLTDRP